MTKPDTRSKAGGTARLAGSSRLSMHEGVEVWDDCCSCETEPYWLEALAEAEAETPPATRTRDEPAAD